MVDDTAVNLDVIRNLLKKTKIVVDTAVSGEEALQLAQMNRYDVIFLDHLMPYMDGPETLKRMKELENNLSEDTPVISLPKRSGPYPKMTKRRTGKRHHCFPNGCLTFRV